MMDPRLSIRSAFTLTLLLLSLAALTGCEGDSNKTVGQTCRDDAECGSGVCFDATCYTACARQEDCTGQMVCVRRETEGEAAVNICQTASDFAGCEDDAACAMLVVGACERAACDTESGPCGVAARPDGEACQTEAGQAGTCAAGACACAPACEGKDCGDDGCGGSCGACAEGEACEEGACVTSGDCTPTTPPDEVCDGLDNDCDAGRGGLRWLGQQLRRPDRRGLRGL